MLKPVVLASRAAAKVAARRHRFGPKRPGWSFRYEAMLELMRMQLSVRLTRDLGELRAAFDRHGEREDRKQRTTWSRVDAGGVPALWARPRGRRTRGTILYLHGGAYVFGSAQSHKGVMASLAFATSRGVLGIDYRLAPEHRCPAAIEDAVEAYRYLLDESHDPTEIVLAGDSAGGGLVVAALVSLRDQGVPLPSGAVLLSPWVDLAMTGPSYEDLGFDYIQLPTGGRVLPAVRAYAGDLPLSDPRVSPLFADLRGLPPLFILAGELEVIVHDARRLAQAAREAGVEVQLHVEPDEVHVYPAFADLNPRGQEAFGRIAAFVEKLEERRAPKVAS